MQCPCRSAGSRSPTNLKATDEESGKEVKRVSETLFTAEDRDLLEQSAFATLALSLPDGSLQNSIMWYRAGNEDLRMIAPEASAKARALRQSPRVSIVINVPGNPYDYLEIRGHADIVADDAAARSELRSIAKRYIGDRADRYVDALSNAPRVMIVVHPERVRRHRSTPPAARGG